MGQQNQNLDFLQRTNSANFNGNFMSPQVSTGSRYLQDMNLNIDPNANLMPKLNTAFNPGAAPTDFNINQANLTPTTDQIAANFESLNGNPVVPTPASNGLFGNGTGALGTDTPWLSGATKGPDGTIIQNTGALNFGLDAVSGIGNLYMGLESLGLAKDQFNVNKGALNRNFANQAQTINNAISDKAIRSFRTGNADTALTEAEYVDNVLNKRGVNGAPVA